MNVVRLQYVEELSVKIQFTTQKLLRLQRHAKVHEVRLVGYRYAAEEGCKQQAFHPTFNCGNSLQVNTFVLKFSDG